jgi:hypothetical protein
VGSRRGARRRARRCDRVQEPGRTIVREQLQQPHVYKSPRQSVRDADYTYIEPTLPTVDDLIEMLRVPGTNTSPTSPAITGVSWTATRRPPARVKLIRDSWEGDLGTQILFLPEEEERAEGSLTDFANVQRYVNEVWVPILTEASRRHRRR